MSHTFSNELYSDLHKDALGFRPCSGDYEVWQIMTDEQKQIRWDYLVMLLSQNEADERAAEERAAQKVEEEITNLIGFGRVADREGAIALMAEQHEVNGDLEYLCWKLGVKYGYFGREHL